MEQTLTQSGALFAAQHKPVRKNRRAIGNLKPETPGVAISTFRATVGDFAIRPVQFGCQLEVRVGKVRRLLGVYETSEAALLALRNRHTHFAPWDGMGRNAVAIQIDTAQRWNGAH